MQETCEPLKSDVVYERAMKMGSLNLLRSVEKARGIYRPPVEYHQPPKPKAKAVRTAPRRIPGEALGVGIIRMVAEAFGLDDLRGRSREREFVHARAVAIQLIREIKWGDGRPRFSFPQIGAMFHRDHSTVIHSYENFPIYCKQSADVVAVYEALR